MAKTTANHDSPVPSAEALLDEIGGFKTTIPINPVPPGEDPEENEIWMRRRAVLTRTLYQNYPRPRSGSPLHTRILDVTGDAAPPL